MGRLFGSADQSAVSGGRIFSGDVSSGIDQNRQLRGLSQATGLDLSANKINIGGINYTRKGDNFFTSNGQKRTIQQLVKLAGIEKQYQQNEQAIKEKYAITPQVVAGEIGKAAYGTLVQPIVDAGHTALQQGQIGAVAGQSSTNISAAKFYLKANEQDFKQGKISKQVYEQQKAKYQTILDINKQKLQKTEKKYGAKYDPSAGALATLELATSFGVPGAIKKTGEVAAGRIFAKGTQETVPQITKDLTPQTANAITNEKYLIPAKTGKGANVITDKSKLLDVGPTNPNLAVISNNANINDIKRLGIVNKLITKAQKTGNITPDVARNLMKERAALIRKIQNPQTIDTTQTIKPSIEPITTKTAQLPTQELKPSGSALKLQSQAIEAGMKEDLGPIAQYASGSYKAEGDRFAQLVKDNPQYVKDVAAGKVQANPIEISAANNALKVQARDAGDWQTLRDLSKSDYHTAVSESAQTLGAEGYFAAKNDPVALMKEIRDTRINAVIKQSKKTEEQLVAKVKNDIIKSTPKVTKETWSSFIKGLEC